MKFNLAQKDIELFNELLFIKETNIGIANLNNYAMGEGYNSLYPIKNISSQEYRELMIKESNLLEEDQDGFNDIKDRWNIFKFDELKTEDYNTNPYYKIVKNINKSYANLKLINDSYFEYEPFVYDELDINSEYIEKYKIGYFKDKFSFISLVEKDRVWMSITPHEINTMKEPLNNMKGNVLIFGLGLGYFSYMCSLKKDVKNIIVIEKNKDIIDLYKKEIEPKLNIKINIINGDAFTYFNNEFIKENNIDSIFVDIYHSGVDLHLYLPFLNLEQNIKNNVVVNYWIEKSLLSYFRRYVITLIDEELSGSKDSDYIKERSLDDKIINYLHRELKNKQISSFKDIKELLTDSSLKEIAKNYK